MSATPPFLRLVRHRVPPEHALHERGSVVTIGSYDGLHLGHQALLKRVCAIAEERGLVSVVMSFEPTPKEFFAPQQAPARLMRFREKFQALRRLGVELFFCPRFDAGMAAVSPQDFAGRLLAGRLKARHVIVGDDFRYARGRSGDTGTLKDAGRRLGFSVERLDTVSVGGTRVSSTTIRAALEAGELDRAARYLGRPYRMSGRVIEGRKLGRTLGFPTANIAVHRRASPVLGIFAVWLQRGGGGGLPGVASVGTRPTVGGGEVLLEVHLFDFDEEFYGEYVDVDFIARLRDEEAFPDLESLRRQMERDAAEARKLLASSHPDAAHE